MKEREELEKAITRLEAQRDQLGVAAVDAALAGLKQRLAELDGSERQAAPEEIPPKHLGERRVVTVLFCDVAGSTELAEGMDPEAWTGIMNDAFEVLIEPVERFGGTVARLMGDAILAFFGAPEAHEDDPQRAVLAGLAIVDDISPLREKLLRENGLEFNVRVGINTGLAVVGDVGSKSAGEYTAMGDAVNVAARMEQTAAPGTVQIAQSTYTLVAPLFECRALGSITVKGKSEPVPAFRVLGRKAEPGHLRGLSDQGISSPLVGRENELQFAQHAVERLMKGQGGILAILGEAGIGKSRLISELHHSTPGTVQPGNQPNTSQASLLWLEGQSLSYGQSISYWPFQQILRAFVGIHDDDSEPAALHKLETSIRDLFPEETAEIMPYLASLLSIKVSGDYELRVKYLDGEALGRQVYRASRRFFQRLAEQSPLVLLFDDLHWMDASSTGLLEHLLPLVQRAPLLLCGLSRPEPESPAARLLELAEKQFTDRLTLIELLPLSPSDSRHLVQNLLEIDGLPDRTRQMMLEKADGNPFYLEEIVRNLIADGTLVHDPSTQRWKATRQIGEVSIPDTIQGLLTARIDRLDEELKRVVRRAAVIGRSFLYRILNFILEDDRDLDQQLDQLQSAELIWEKQRIPELEYIFKHALAQEAAYEGILLQERRKVHAKVGAAIESLMEDRLDEFYGLLAYHYSAAEQWEKAQEYLFKAGDQAGRMAADAEALAFYGQAMEAYTRIRGETWDPIERAQLERKIGEAYYRLGDFGQARAYLERSLALLGVNLPSSKWGVRLAIARAFFTQAAHRLFPSRIVQSMGNSPDPVTKEIYLVLSALGWIEAVADIERYLLVTVKSLNVNEQGGYAFGSTHVVSSLASGFDVIGWNGLADRYFRLTEDYARRIDPPQPVFQMEWCLSLHFNLLANSEKSLHHALRAVEIAQSTGDLRRWGSAMHVVAWAQFFNGRLSGADEASREIIAVAEEGSDPQALCWGLFGLGAAQRRLGEIDEAIASLERAIEVAKAVPDYHTQVGAGSWLARCYILKGKLDQALSMLESSQKILLDHSVVVNSPYLYDGLSEVYLAAAENSSGQVRQGWLKKAGRACRQAVKTAKINRPPLPDAMMFLGRYEWIRGKRTAAQNWWGKALEEAQHIGDPYLEGTIHLEIGARTGDRSNLLQAETILAEIGAEYELAKARESLAKARESLADLGEID